VAGVVGVVEKGTRLCVTELRKHDALFQKGWVYPLARIEDGDFRGTVVNIYDLSNKLSKGLEPPIPRKPDPRLLHPVVSGN
jgi:hypothetical protein